MFEKAKYKDEEEMEAWRKVMKMEICVQWWESANEDGKEVFVTKPLPWQSERVTLFKQTLDEAAKIEKTPLARRQMKERRTGVSSSRPKPIGEFPAWVFKDQSMTQLTSVTFNVVK